MNLDWRRLKAVVLQSDDWGLAAWSADDQAHRVLAGSPAFRSPAGMIYGRSTLESAADVDALAKVLGEFRGADGFPPVWQANTVLAAPAFDAFGPPLFECTALPVVEHPEAPTRWHRPGLWDAVRRAEEAGVWRAELHGLHHLPESAWLQALRRGQHDARRAFEQQCFVCEAVEAGGEYDALEPREVRATNLRRALTAFERLFGRRPDSFCPPDYRFDEWFEAEAESVGLTTFQGKPEQAGRGAWTPFRRRWLGLQFPHRVGARFYLPPRTAFEPRGRVAADAPFGVAHALRGVREAWSAGRPAILSTHRLNYAHLDGAWSEAGRTALRELLAGLVGDGAEFLTDAEVRQLCDRSWSVRPVGTRGALLRYHGVPRAPVRFPVPPHAARGVFGEGSADGTVEIQGGEAEVRVNVGEHLLTWRSAWEGA